jgi:hypothetical protein
MVFEVQIMNRLEAERQRLYDCNDAGCVRALVLQLAARSAWDALAPVWSGVQADLQLPAPAIAIDGAKGYQLWFSLAQPVPAAEAMRFLEALRRRWLAEIPADRLALSPSPAKDAPRCPPFAASPDHWSAFVASDLAALFADEPWLDIPPGADAQADLLASVQSIAPADWRRACAQLAPAASPANVEAGSGASPAVRHGDPQAFLLAVMNDPGVELQLRIEAAKALLGKS